MVYVPMNAIPGEPGGGVALTGGTFPTGQIGITGFLAPTSMRQPRIIKRRKNGKKKKR